MRKALAQNPNMLRALLTFSITLIVLLAYIVYGATLDSGAYVYRTRMSASSASSLDDGLTLVANGTDDDGAWWTWTFSTRTTNLSWVNVTVVDGPHDGSLSLANPNAGYWSHALLGDADAVGFACREADREASIECDLAENHSRVLGTGGDGWIIGLASLTQPLSGEGSLFAENEAEAEARAKSLVDQRHASGGWRVTVRGEAGIAPEGMIVNATWVNHDWDGIEPFAVAPGVELIWGLTAVAGTLTLLMVPLIAVYLAAQAREKRQAAELQAAAAAAAPPSDDE